MRLKASPACLCGVALAGAAMFVLATGIHGQSAHDMQMPDGLELVDQVPPDKLPPPRKIAGVGNAHIPITASRAVQEWFDQGLNLYHDYWDYEAARAFEQAIRLDPQCAMCYWGLGRAEAFYHSNSQGYAKPAFERAAALIDRVSDREQLYLRAMMADTKAAPDILRTLVQRYPDDIEAQLLLAPWEKDRYVTALEWILKAHPENSAANHAYIHALEAGDHPERALHSAEILARLAPGSGHMVHMPGHIFFRLGDYARAEQAFAASEHVDEQYMREQHVDPDNDWNYVHNLMYAVANFLEEGKFQAAMAASMKLGGARGMLDSTLYTYSTRDSMSRLEPRLPAALRTANWQQVLELLDVATIPDGRPNLAFLATQLRSVAVGMRAIDMGDLAAATEASGSLDRAVPAEHADPGRGEVPNPTTESPPKNQVRPDALLPPILGVLRIMAFELRGSLLMAQGRRAEAAEIFEKAASAEKDLGYREPPIYIRPVYESYGVALLAAGDVAGARQAFERALGQRPRSGFELYGLALCSEKNGDIARALKEHRAFLDAWKNADRSILQVTHAREFVAANSARGERSRDRSFSIVPR
jgi:tetratricopeptide (TPR) repeat protein